MSVKIARDWVNTAFTNNQGAVRTLEKWITLHILLAIVFGVLAITVNVALAWVECYVVPALSVLVKQFVSVTRNNSAILGKANDTLKEVNNQTVIEQRIREKRESAKQRRR